MSERSSYLADVLRAEAAGEDLQESEYGVHVCAMREDGTLYELGKVSDALVYQDPNGARAVIERIKFAPRTQRGPTPPVEPATGVLDTVQNSAS